MNEAIFGINASNKASPSWSPSISSFQLIPLSAALAIRSSRAALLSTVKNCYVVIKKYYDLTFLFYFSYNRSVLFYFEICKVSLSLINSIPDVRFFDTSSNKVPFFLSYNVPVNFTNVWHEYTDWF